MRRVLKKKSIFSGLGRLFILGIWVVVLGVIFVLLGFLYYARQIPDPETIITRHVNESTKIYDRTGEVLLYDVFEKERRTIIPLEQIPGFTRDAVIAAEDAQFYHHRGFDVTGVFRALLKNIRDRSISQGGSTITQQLVKSSLLTKERTFSRKFREIILSLEIERRFSKDQILWMYLNQIPFGSSIYGIESAAQTYFKKHTPQLTLRESITLASMIKAPSYYSPFGLHGDELLQRTDQILDKMLEEKTISRSAYDTAKNEKLVFSNGDKGILAPHFVIMVRERLLKKYGEERVENGGLRVITSLDWNLQQIAEEILKRYAERNEKLYKARNAGLIALDPRTGEVLAMIGSRDYFDIENEGNFNVTTAFRQPGSAFKPIAYAVALEKGFPDTTVVFDAKIEFNPGCSPDSSEEKDRFGLDCYHPQNYDGQTRGPVSMRKALGNSLNIPSVQFLYLAGVQDVIKQAQKMGITSLDDPSRFGLSLVLGGAEVSLLELANAYAAFANDGIYTPYLSILKVSTQNGIELENNEPKPERVLSENTSGTINSILSDNSARAQIFGLKSPMYFSDFQVAAKTGTTQENRDAWILGYTPNFVAGIWVGNNDNAPMTKEGAGISAAGPMWHEFMLKGIEGRSIEFFKEPEPIFIDKIMLNGKIEDPTLGIHTILRFVDKNDPLGGIPDDPFLDPQYKNWEWAVQNWLSQK